MCLAAKSKRVASGRRLALIVAALIGSAGAAAPSDSDQRLAVPDPQSRAKSAKLIAELFQNDLARIRNTDQEAAYAVKLLDSAAETTDDPAGRFELFEEARTAAAHAGDGETAMRAVSQISDAYRADGLGLAAQTLSVVVAHASAHSATRALPLIDDFMAQSIAADRFDLATLGANLAVDAAQKSRDASLMARAEASAKDLETLKAAYQGVPAARAKLAQNPTDSDANLIVGRYYCLYKADWGALVPLSRGSDAALKELASKDLGAGTDSPAMMMAGDGWWDWATDQTGPPRQNARARAVYWYQKALPQLEGLSKLLADHRIFDFRAEHPQTAPPAQ
jgi:hypothetical protein